MTAAVAKTETRDIVVDEIFPHPVETIWRALTSADLIGRWLMQPAGFEAVVGNRFTFQTTPAGAWDGTIECRVLEVVPNRCLSHSWRSGDAGNTGYGAPLDTVVTYTLAPVEAGTRLRIVHAGFVVPRNDIAFKNMNDGWRKVVKRLDAAVPLKD